jgi:hypothetical protein
LEDCIIDISGVPLSLVNVPAGVRNIPLPLFSERAWNLR